jgi:cyclic pyranopterin phosphate synthase
VKAKTVPKGDVLEVARAAGIQAAKRTSEWIVFCHPIPLDWIDLQFELNETRIIVTAEVEAIWKTGVEMEAMTAVSAALLNIYDMLKPLENNISFSEIKLLNKQGGKTQFTDVFEQPITAAVLVISDSTFAGKREDKSGKAIKEFLDKQPVRVTVYEILPDIREKITNRLIELVDEHRIQLIFTSGGTGLGPKDLTPEATKPILDKEVPGISEAIRRHGRDRTPFAMLSRELAGFRKNPSLSIFPGVQKERKKAWRHCFPGCSMAFRCCGAGDIQKMVKGRSRDHDLHY